MARIFELRTYYAEPGRFEELSDRFRNGSVALFEKHGMQVLGFWVTTDNEGSEPDKLIYLLAFPDRSAADASWAGFRADPDWLSLREKTEANGSLVAKIESVFLEPTDYSNLQ